VLLFNKLLLTGLLIFVKPDTVSQLAAGFMISLVFFALHVEIRPYNEENEDSLQYNATLSVTLTLFGGILLKTHTQANTASPLLLVAVLNQVRL
jgi:hypothetical protein